MAKQWNSDAWVSARLRRNGAGAQVINAAESALDMGIPATDVYAAASRGLGALDRLVDSYNVVDAEQPQARYQAPRVVRQVVERQAAPNYAPLMNGLRALMAQRQGQPLDQVPMMRGGPDFEPARVMPVAVANPAAAGPSTATSGLLGYQVYKARLYVESGGILSDVTGVSIDSQPIAFSPTGVALPGALLDPDTFHQGTLYAGDVTAQVVVNATATGAGRWTVYLHGIPSIAPRVEQFAGRGCGCPGAAPSAPRFNWRELEDMMGGSPEIRDMAEMIARG